MQFNVQGTKEYKDKLTFQTKIIESRISVTEGLGKEFWTHHLLYLAAIYAWTGLDSS